MSITDIPQDNVLPFRGEAATVPEGAIEEPTDCLEADLDLQDECTRIDTIITLLRLIVREEENVTHRAWLMEELERAIAALENTVSKVNIVADPDRVHNALWANWLENANSTVETRLSNIDAIIRLLNYTIHEDRYMDLRTGLVAYLDEEFSIVDKMLDQAALRPRTPAAH